MNSRLDSFRAFAFLAVFLFHMPLYLGSGYLGVQAFFVLSGFLLTPILIEMKRTLPARAFFANFYGRRFLRIFPLYYFYLAAASGIILTLSALSLFQSHEFELFWTQLPWAVFYLYNFHYVSDGLRDSAVLTHFWSLAVEEQFYLIWPLVIFCVSSRYLKSVLFCLIVLGPLLRLLTAHALGSQWLPITSVRIDHAVYVSLFSHLDAFAIGGYASLWRGTIRSHYIWLLIVGAVLLGLLTSAISTGEPHWRAFGYVSFMRDSYKYVWGYSLFGLIFALIILGIRAGVFLPRITSWPLLQYMGKISYGLYVYHFPLCWIVSLVIPTSATLAYISVTLLSTIIISVFSYECVEKRFLKMKDRYFPRSQ